MSDIDADDKFIQIVESVCARPGMYLCDGSFLEVCAFLTGFAVATPDCPLGGSCGFIAFSRYVARHFGFPENYGWPGIIKWCSRSDSEAIEKLSSLLMDFCRLSRTQSLDEILDSVQPRIESKPDAEPEQTMRRLQAALLTCRRDEIEPLIIDHPDADTLWTGNYPPDVATKLGEVYRSNPIGRVSGTEEDGEVKLLTAELPFPLTVKKVGQHWKVDLGELIKLRKATGEFKSS